MIDALTIIFALIMFCVIWFLIFKFVLIVDKKKQFKGIEEKIAKQNIKTDLIDQIKKQHAENIQPKENRISPDFIGDNPKTMQEGTITPLPADKPKKIKKKFSFMPKFFKKKKEVKKE